MPYKSALIGRVLGVRWTGAPTAIDVDRLEAETHSGFGRASAPLVLVAVPRSLAPPDPDVRARIASMMRATAAQIERFYLVIEGSGPGRALKSGYRSKMTAPGTIGTRPTGVSCPLPSASNALITPSAADRPKALPPVSRNA